MTFPRRPLLPPCTGLLLALVLLLPVVARAEVLYFALEVRQAGRLVARPRLLGETGKPLRAERRQPGASAPDYRLSLLPSPAGEGYSLALDVALGPPLGGGRGHSDVPLRHGQQRRVELGERPGELEVSVLLMRVDSPEFRALMALPPAPTAPEGPPSI